MKCMSVLSLWSAGGTGVTMGPGAEICTDPAPCNLLSIMLVL